jgi:hypothetical protein
MKNFLVIVIYGKYGIVTNPIEAGPNPDLDSLRVSNTGIYFLQSKRGAGEC